MDKKWTEIIIEAFQNLGGDAKYSDLYDEIESITGKGRKVKDFTPTVRGAIETHSSDSTTFNGTPGSDKDLFVSLSGIGKGHWGVRKDKDYNQSEVNLTASLEEFEEGKQVLKKHLKRERNSRLIKEAKKNFINQHGSLHCEACDFNFKDKYNIADVEFIEAHHLKPISELKEGEKTKIEDIVMLCPNCHRMIHKYRPWISEKRDIKKILK